MVARAIAALLAALIAVGPLPVYAVPDPGHLVVAQARDADLDIRPTSPSLASTLAVLILSGEEAGVPLSDIYSGVRRVVEAHTALNVAPLDAIGLAEREAAVRECAGKAACFASKVRGTAGVGLLLTVSVDRLDEGLLLGFRLVDVRSEQEIGATGDEVPMGMSVSGAMEEQLPSVFPPSVWDQIADVSIKTEPANAEVSVAGRACASPCSLTRLLPGTYEINIRKAGYEPWRGTVTLAARETTSVEAALEAPAGGIVSSPLFWGAVGLAAIGVGVGAFFLFRPDDRVVNICVARDRALCNG